MLRKLLPFLFLLCMLASPAGRLQSQIITTIAGGPTAGYTGDGGPATAATLGNIFGLAIDGSGNIYLADQVYNVIRKINTAGIITTIAGMGVLGYSGDGGPAITARLDHPYGVAVDGQGNIYCADQYGAVVRRIGPGGIITTIAGSLTPTGNCGGDGPAISTTFSQIGAINTDNAGNIYVSDVACNNVRKIDGTGNISLVVGNGINGFSGDGGPATQAQLYEPGKVAFDAAGNMYIPDVYNQRIRMVNTTGIITTIAGSSILYPYGDGGPAIDARFFWPYSVCVDATGNLFISDLGHHAVRRVDPAGIITAYAGNYTAGYSGDGGPATQAEINNARDIVTDAAGNLYIADGTVIRKVTPCQAPVVLSQPSDATVCSGANAVITASGTQVTTQLWQVNTGNGWQPLANDNTYSGVNTGTLSINNVTGSMDKNLYRCLLTNSCENIVSGQATLHVLGNSPPVVTINASATQICQGDQVTFTAVTQNGGPSPQLQWLRNGQPVNGTGDTWSATDLATADLIQCRLTPDNPCAAASAVTSDPIRITVTASVTPGIRIVASPDTAACNGTTILFNAIIDNGGDSPGYLWQKNSSPVGGGSHYSDSELRNGDTIQCTLSSTAVCATPAQVSDLFIAHVRSCPLELYLPSAFTPNGDGHNDLFKAALLRGNLAEFDLTIYNRLGAMVFQTTNPAKGWDGTFAGKRQPTNTYVWVCRFRFSGDVVRQRTGTLLLIR